MPQTGNKTQSQPKHTHSRPKGPPRNGLHKVKVPQRARRSLSRETFADLAFEPRSIRFEHQNDDEHMLMLVREHVSILIWNGLVTIFGVVLPVALWYLHGYLLKQGILPFTIEPRWWYVGTILWYLFLFSAGFRRFVDWFYNVNLMTDQRFIDLDFSTFTGHKVKETPLLKIQDASDSHSGPWQMIFDMGDLTIFTASDKTTFNLPNVPASSQVRDFIMDVVIAYTDQFKSDEIISAP